MKVRELIELLKKQDQESEVMVEDYQDYLVIHKDKNVHLATTEYLDGKKTLLVILEVDE